MTVSLAKTELWNVAVDNVMADLVLNRQSI